jgi:hypothetical protein
MATPRTRKTKTSDDLKKELEEARKKLAALEQRAFAGELDEAIAKANFVTEFAKIKMAVPKVSDVAILQAIGNAVGIKRVQVTQAPVQPRAKSTTPRGKKAANK